MPPVRSMRRNWQPERYRQSYSKAPARTVAAYGAWAPSHNRVAFATHAPALRPSRFWYSPAVPTQTYRMPYQVRATQPRIAYPAPPRRGYAPPVTRAYAGYGTSSYSGLPKGYRFRPERQAQREVSPPRVSRAQRPLQFSFRPAPSPYRFRPVEERGQPSLRGTRGPTKSGIKPTWGAPVAQKSPYRFRPDSRFRQPEPLGYAVRSAGDARSTTEWPAAWAMEHFHDRRLPSSPENLDRLGDRSNGIADPGRWRYGVAQQR